MRICSTESEGLSRRLGNHSERNAFSVIVEEIAESVLDVTAERDAPLLWSTDYKMLNESLERKRSK